jgi:regulator of cell morphogenesis and NO signaling
MSACPVGITTTTLFPSATGRAITLPRRRNPVEECQLKLWLRPPQISEFRRAEFELAAKVATVHGERHPELRQVQELLALLADDLEPHMSKEERVLFPAITRLTEGAAEFPFGSINNPIRMMTLEHDRAGDLLARLGAVTNQYTTPTDGCASYCALYDRLALLDHDTRLHLFEENHFLFPQAAALEAASGR